MVARAVGDRKPLLNHGSAHVAAGNPLFDFGVAAYEHALRDRLRRRSARPPGCRRGRRLALRFLRVRTRASVGNAVASVSPPRGIDGPGPSGGLHRPARARGRGRLSRPSSSLVCCRRPGGRAHPLRRGLARGPGAAGGRRLGALAARSPFVAHAQVQARLADALVLCLSMEGFPNRVLGGRRGLAVLTYGVGGRRELLERRRLAPSGISARGRSDYGSWPKADGRDGAGEALRRTVSSTYTWPPVVDRVLTLTNRGAWRRWPHPRRSDRAARPREVHATVASL